MMRGGERVRDDSVGVLVMRRGNVLSMDAGARRLFGSDLARIGRIIAPFGDEAPVPSDKPAADMPTGIPVETTEFQLVDVPHRWFEVSRVSADMWPDDMFVVVRDVTEERRSRGLHEVVCALLLHELRTPMTSITAAADLLAKGGGNGHAQERAHGLIADIVVETRRLELLMDDLTVLADLEPDPVLTPEPMLVQHVLPQIVGRGDGADGDPEVGLDVEPDLPVVSVDSDALQRVIATLIGGARRNGARHRLEVVARRSGTGVEIRIRQPDQHGALDPELLGRFGYLLLTRETGTAADLGAHTAYRLVDAMGGRMWTGSAGGVGTEFGIWLPPQGADGG